MSIKTFALPDCINSKFYSYFSFNICLKVLTHKVSVKAFQYFSIAATFFHAVQIESAIFKTLKSSGDKCIFLKSIFAPIEINYFHTNKKHQALF